MQNNTKIPKFQSKTPKPASTATHSKTTSAVPKVLATVFENEPSTSSLGKIKPILGRNMLRRRSKSVTDLRPTNLKAMQHDKTSISSIKPGQKRQFLSKTTDEVKKPKIAKKIPDWDYKARFNQLTEKHSLLQKEHQNIKTTLADLGNIETEVKLLRQNTKEQEITVSQLEQEIKHLTEEKKELTKTNTHLVKNISSLSNELNTLKTEHDILIKENKDNLRKLENIEETHIATVKELEELKECFHKLVDQNHQLKLHLEEQENVRRNLHNTIQDLKGNIRVFCRVRPPIGKEENQRQLCTMFFPDEATLEIRKTRESKLNGKIVDYRQEFTFDKVFPSQSTQEEVFEELSQLVQSALDGYHVCIFAYGQTGSGKTYTMQGTPHDHGMIPRTVNLIFEKIQKMKQTEWTFEVTASFLEIYNENIRDLLVPNSTHNYELRYNEGRGVTVTNLEVVPISTSDEMNALIDKALKNRAVAATDFNKHSSRSHAITKISLQSFNNIKNRAYCGSISLVDLAGSESAKTSAAERLAETKNINKSLSALGNVMKALYSQDSHIPYRDSKLTYLLQSSLGGNCKTLMFVNISPFEECYGESVNSLRFASNVKDVKINAKRNKILY